MYHPRLKGNHYDMGKHYGDLLYKTGEDLSSVIKLSDKQKSFGQKCLPIYEKYMSEIMMEVRGLAEGLHQKYEDLACWLFNIYCNEICEGNPNKSKYKFDNRLEWGLNKIINSNLQS